MIQIELDNVKLREAAQSGELVEILDPSSGRTFVLIPSEQYERMCTVISADLDPRELYPLIEQAMAEDDAQDPLLDSYQ